ncbi:aspartate/glutamate racemase family protein [Salipaludibacillus daqingensis]|uniref:aspartate/glutamate racemase family protein n=1 Tax=Salipaludibacillus daqingensis TaxID=3041001 RepID=UPI002475CD0E|nr:amino acid racemase [Salipaludibacillus daqingensis]
MELQNKTIGILGGMGPAATVELFSRIVNNTVATSDQEHVNMVIINDPQIPDRSKYILEKGESPLPKLKDNLIKLYNAGADVAIIPCMTAHSFITELQYHSPIPIINAIELVEKHIKETFPFIEKVGLLATTGSVKSGVYQKYLTKTIYTLDEHEQNKLMGAIYDKDGIKGGNISDESASRVLNVLETLKDRDVDAVIAGCTELGLVLNDENAKIPVIDPIFLLAKEAVRIGNHYTLVENK